jgi:hypothetical protein
MASSAFASAGLVKGGGRLILEIDIGERLSVVVAHDKAGVLFLDSPRWREAERHSPGIAVPGHATGIDGYCVLSWSSPGRRLVGRRKVVLDFSPADRLIVKNLIEPPVDAPKPLW